MGRDPSAIDTLKKFYSDRLAVVSEEELVADLESANDRSVVITLTALAEDAVEWAIGKRLRGLTRNEYTSAFDGDGPYSTLARKIIVGYAMGIFDSKLRDQLNDLRSIRNACAHTKRPISFEAPQLANATKRLFHPNGRFAPKDDTTEALRETFKGEVAFMMSAIAVGRQEAERGIQERYRLDQIKRAVAESRARPAASIAE